MPIMRKFASIEADVKEKLLAGLGSMTGKADGIAKRQKELIENKKKNSLR